MLINLEQFHDKGFQVFPGVMAMNEVEAIKQRVDRYNEIIMEKESPLMYFKELLFHPQVQHLVSSILGSGQYVVHHLHASCHRAGMPSLGWHHDYEAFRKSDRTHNMIHVFLYLNGMRREIGELLVVPGSHKTVFGRYEYSSFDFNAFPDVVSIDELPVGSIVVVHSALCHARRALPGGECHPRYFIDLSFCHTDGCWMPYLEGGDWRKLLSELCAYAEGAYDGRYSFMFNSRVFKTRFKDKALDYFKVRALYNRVRVMMNPNKVKNGM